VAVAGNIGAGKTELVQFLSRRYALAPAFEPHEQNPYLEAFYADMRAWAFHSQLSFLALKLRLHRQLQSAPHGVIQDRTLYEDAEIFERQLHRQRLIDDRDHATYRALYEAASEGLRPPDLMIFLRCPVRTLLKRIARRGRSMERSVPHAYLAALGELYEAWREAWTLSPVVIVETDQVDHLTDLVDRIALQQALLPHLGPARISPETPHLTEDG